MAENVLMTQEPLIRFLFFFGGLAVMAIWERVAPSRPLSVSKSLRWGSNLGIIALARPISYPCLKESSGLVCIL